MRNQHGVKHPAEEQVKVVALAASKPGLDPGLFWSAGVAILAYTWMTLLLP